MLKALVLHSASYSIGIDMKMDDKIKHIGNKEALLRIKAKHDVCLHMLYALEGAVQGVRKGI